MSRDVYDIINEIDLRRRRYYYIHNTYIIHIYLHIFIIKNIFLTETEDFVFAFELFISVCVSVIIWLHMDMLKRLFYCILHTLGLYVWISWYKIEFNIHKCERKRRTNLLLCGVYKCLCGINDIQYKYMYILKRLENFGNDRTCAFTLLGFCFIKIRGCACLLIPCWYEQKKKKQFIILANFKNTWLSFLSTRLPIFEFTITNVSIIVYLFVLFKYVLVS